MTRTMTDDEVLALVAVHEKASLGSDVAGGVGLTSSIYSSQRPQTTLEIDRYNALNMFLGRPLGNEVPDRSQVILNEFRDVVEWAIPMIMRMFVGSRIVARFDPENENDRDQADLETEVVNHVFMNENNGFFVLYDMFKDALMLRNGYVKVYFKTQRTSRVERYSGLTEIEVTKLLSPEGDDRIEVIEQSERTVLVDPMQGLTHTLAPNPATVPAPGPQQTGSLAAPLQKIPITVFDLKTRRISEKGRVCVEALPPEEVFPASDATGSLRDASFVEHKGLWTRSALLEMGYDKDEVEKVDPGPPKWIEMDALARDQTVDELTTSPDFGAAGRDRSMDEIEVRQVWIRMDYDGDGIAELRRLLIAGQIILENEEVPSVEIASCIPMRMPHRHLGISYYDLLGDLQIIKSTLFRQGLDNLYLANNPRIGVDWRNTNADDLLTSRPMGMIRTNGPPNNALMPIQMPSNMIEQVVPAIKYIDSVREMRTGISKSSMGLDVDELQDVTRGGQLAAMSSASLKLELVARLLAEGVKEIFQLIRDLLIRHQDQPMQLEIAGKWVTIDPSSWGPRSRVTVNVGLGSGNREEARANLMMLGQMQQQIAPLGLVGPVQAWNTFKMGTEILGFANPERFAIDPDSQQYQQIIAQKSSSGQPTPQEKIAMLRLQAAQQSAQIKLQIERERQAGANAAKIAQLQARLQEVEEQSRVSIVRSQADMARAGLELSHARSMADESNDAQLVQTIIKAIAQIVAQQIRQQPSADAGSILGHDTQEASQIVESISPTQTQNLGEQT